jgi:hypothetical protein
VCNSPPCPSPRFSASPAQVCCCPVPLLLTEPSTGASLSGCLLLRLTQRSGCPTHTSSPACCSAPYCTAANLFCAAPSTPDAAVLTSRAARGSAPVRARPHKRHPSSRASNSTPPSQPTGCLGFARRSRAEAGAGAAVRHGPSCVRRAGQAVDQATRHVSRQQPARSRQLGWPPNSTSCRCSRHRCLPPATVCEGCSSSAQRQLHPSGTFRAVRVLRSAWGSMRAMCTLPTGQLHVPAGKRLCRVCAAGSC